MFFGKDGHVKCALMHTPWSAGRPHAGVPSAAGVQGAARPSFRCDQREQPAVFGAVYGSRKHGWFLLCSSCSCCVLLGGLVPVVFFLGGWGGGGWAAGEPGGLAERSAAPSCRPYPGGRARTGPTLGGSPAPVYIGSAYVKPQAKARSVRGQGPRMPVSRTAKSARSVTAAGPWEGGRGRAPCFRGLPVPGGTAALAAAGAGLPPRVASPSGLGEGEWKRGGRLGIGFGARARRPAGWLGAMARVLLNQKSCAPWMRKVPVLF